MSTFLAKTTPGLQNLATSYMNQITNNVDFYIKSVAVSKMSIIAMIKGKIKL